MKDNYRRASALVLALTLAAGIALCGCGKKAGPERETSPEGGEPQKVTSTVDPLFVESLQVMLGETSYHISGELDLEFQIYTSTPGEGKPYQPAPAGIPYEAFHVSKAGESASKVVLATDKMAVDENVPPSLLPLETGNAFFLVDGLYYWEDPSGWQSEPYNPVEAMLCLNLRGLMPEDILNWLSFAESALPVVEDEEVIGFEVKLGEKYLQGLKAQAQEALEGEALEDALYALQAVEKLLPSVNILALVKKETKRISEIQFGYQGYFSDILKGLPEDSPLKELGFFYSSSLVYDGYGSAYNLQPPL